MADYCNKYHNQNKDFTEGDRIPYASRVYDSEEMVNLVDSALEFWLTSGRYTDEFERELAEYLGVTLLLPGEFRFLREPDRVHGADLPASGGAPGEAGATR